MNPSRGRILSALRSARAGKPEATVGVTAPRVDEAELFRDFPVKDHLLLCFRRRFEALSGELIETDDRAEAARALRDTLRGLQPESGNGAAAPSLRCATQRFPLLDELRAVSSELHRLLQSSDVLPEDSLALSRYDVGVTCADALLARTGGLFVRATTSGGRRLSVLPPVHIVVAETRQLVASIGDALATLRDDLGCSFATMIHGPSRTADIEKILVLGAHGPRRLMLILVRS